MAWIIWIYLIPRFILSSTLFSKNIWKEKNLYSGATKSMWAPTNIQTPKMEVVEKFRAFTDHYIRYIESFGKQACVWGALTHAKGDTPVKSENVIMNAWYNGYADPKEMIKQGYHLISIPDGLVYIVPQAGYYYDSSEYQITIREMDSCTDRQSQCLKKRTRIF